MAKYKADRAVTATALVHIAECHHKLGNAEAQQVYERVARDFADQKHAADIARTRLATLTASGGGKARAESQLTTRKVWSGTAASGQSVDGPIWGLSPDGRYLTFGQLNNLFVRDTASGETRQVTRGGAGGTVTRITGEPYEYPAEARFSGDGLQLAYGWRRPSGYQLRIIDVDGRHERTVTDNPEHEWIGPADWSPDRTRILAKVNSRGNAGQIAWVSLTDGAVQVLKTVPWTALGRISLSPDGRHVAYDQRNDKIPTARTIFVASADGTREVAVTDGSSRDELIGWLPDGGALAFVTLRSGSPELWMLPMKDGDVAGAPRLIKRDIGAIQPIGFTKQGSLFYKQIVTTGDAYVASVDWDAARVVEPKKINTNLVVDFGTAWSPDGSQVAYVAHRGTEAQRRIIAIHTLRDGRTREVAPADDLLIQGTGGHKWSPDGSAYLLNGDSPRQASGTFAMDLRTGQLRGLASFPNAYAQIPQWLDSGRSLLYVVRDRLKPTARVVVQDVASGSQRELRHGFESMQVAGFLASPDERTLAFIVAGPQQPSVMRVMPLAGGSPRSLVEAPGYALWPLAWTPDSQRLIYSRTDRSRNPAGNPRALNEPVDESVWVVPVTGGQPRHLTFPHPAPCCFDIHPDGRRIVYRVGGSQPEVWATERLSSFKPTP